jgi:uncharacterized protein (TIGR02996 family)
MTADADEDALVREILADPWDELARNVYADWLEDHGRPHHAELARGPAKRNDQRVDDEGYWQAARAAAPRPGVRLIHRSGFVAAQVSGRDFVSKQFQADGPAWLRAHHITWLELEGALDWVKASASPALAETCGLRLFCQPTGPLVLTMLAGLQAFWLPQEFGELRWLDITAKCEELAGLVWLTVPCGWMRDTAALRRLAEGPLATGLKHLCLLTQHLSDKEATALVRPPLAGSLVTLRLAGCNLSPKAVRALAKELTGLKNLDLAENYLSNEALAALARSPLLARLKRLGLARSKHATLGGLRAVAEAVAAVPGLRLVLSKDQGTAHNEVLGERLILE